MADDTPQKLIREKVVSAQTGGDVTKPMGGVESTAPAEISMDKMLRDQAYRHRLQMNHFDQQIAATSPGVDRDLLELGKLEATYMFNRDQDNFVGSSTPSTKTISSEQVVKSRIDAINSKYGSNIKYPSFPVVGERVGN